MKTLRYSVFVTAERGTLKLLRAVRSRLTEVHRRHCSGMHSICARSLTEERLQGLIAELHPQEPGDAIQHFYQSAARMKCPCCMHLSLLCMYWQCLQQHSSLLAAPAITLHSNPMPFLEGPMPTPPTAAPMTTLLPTSCCEPNPTLDPTWTCSLTQTPSPTPTSSPTKTPTINTGPITDVQQFWDFECQAKV